MIFRATAALPYENRARATAALRGQLRLMAVAAGVSPDWFTLVVGDPAQAVGPRGRMWFEWTASVAGHGTSSAEEVLPDAR